MDQHNYKITEEKEDWHDTVIEKDNIKSTFTIRNFEDNIARAQKVLAELEGTHKVNLAMMDNIERNHPWIKKMTPERLNTASMYWEAKQIVMQYAPRIAEYYEAINQEHKEMEHVKALFDFKDEPKD